MRKILTMVLAMSAVALASLAASQDVRVTEIDTRGGSAKLSTDAENARITVIQLDENNKPIQSWTVQTDSDGKAVIPVDNLRKGHVQVRRLNLPDLIAPTNIIEGEVVMVAMPKSIEGEVIDIKTVEGEVVATKKADKFGRIFLPTTLVAGAYMLTRSGSPKGAPITVQSTGNLPNMPSSWADGTSPIHVPVNGTGAATGSFGCAPRIELPVLAESPRQVVVANPADYGIAAGTQTLMIKDENGAPIGVQTISIYNLHGVINRSKLMSGEAAHVDFRLEPGDLKGTLTIGVMNGPVRLAGGGQTQTVALDNGVGTAVVQSVPGQTGPFQLGWMFKPDQLATNGHDTVALPPEPFTDPKTGDKVTPQERRPGYSRDLIEHKGGGSTIVERVDNGEFVKGDPLETVKEIHTDGETITTTEILRHKDTGEIISGTKKVVKKVGDKEETQSSEKWDAKSKSWKAG